ncbi:unnamed protein product, partial [Rotaria magnacalcarata]
SKKTLDDALIYSIVKDSRPFGDFRKAGFQHFLQVILPGTNYKGPHRVTVKKRLVNLYSSYRRKLIEEFSTINHIGLTVDAWTSPSRAHFICITAHYYDKDFGLLSRVLAFRRFIGRTFAMRLREFIRNELRKLKINDKIRCITTDNGMDVKLATNNNEFGFRISCLAHNINLTISNGLNLWNKKKNLASTTVQDNVNDPHDANNDEVCDDDVTDDDDSNGSDVTDDEITPSSHDGFNDDSDSYDEDSDLNDDEQQLLDREQQYDMHHMDLEQSAVLPNSKLFIFTLLKRIRRLFAMIHHSSIIDAYVSEQIRLKQQEADQSIQNIQNLNLKKVRFNNPVIDFAIRWSSTFKMVTRFIKLRSIINDITHTPENIDGIKHKQRSKLCQLAFSHSDWNWLISLEYVLHPFEQSTCLLSGRSYQTLAIGKIVMNGLKHFLST